MELKTLQSDQTKWFDIPGTGISVELKLPNRDSLLKDYRSVQSKDGHVQDVKWYRIAAQKYILNCKGLTENGKDVEYTMEVGFLLMNNQVIGPFIDKMLTSAGDWVEEGNGFSGTD